MPADRVLRSPSNRSTPLPKGRYTIPGSLPPAFGVSELFDWSTARTSTSTVASRSPSVGHSTFKRHSQKQTPSSVRARAKAQGSHSPSNDCSHIFGIATTANEQPLFAPTRYDSPTPTKRGSSQVPLQLPSPILSPLKAQPKLRPTTTASEKVAPQSSTRRITSPSMSPAPVPRPSAARYRQDIHEESGDVSETSDVEVLSDDGEEPDEEISEEDESENESKSEAKSESNGSGRMRASKYIDRYAEEARSSRPNNSQVQRAAVEEVDRWMGPTRGLLQFRKRPNSQGVMPPGKWSFSNNGVSKQPLKDREVGDIHFSSPYSGETEEYYWVCVDYPKRKWAQCVEGQAHPSIQGYVLRLHDGTKPPQWILAQSLRANRSRGRRSMD
ncbi:hypothetical protein FRC08_004305 [Ceratobasidium sp. 394]|nr:hypothetical protein FRC08_004305 [Ceratobasidium sp. 394]